MTRFMYDAVTPKRIPSDASMVAGYADGRFANLTEMAQRFPHAKRVSIAVHPTTRAQVLDVEPGCSSPEEAVRGKSIDELWAVIEPLQIRPPVRSHAWRGHLRPLAGPGPFDAQVVAACVVGEAAGRW